VALHAETSPVFALRRCVLVWVLVSKSYKIMAGAAVALGASCAITYFLDPLAWTHYSQMMRISGINQELIPCLSFLLRHWLSPQSIWLQYVPASLACAWALPTSGRGAKDGTGLLTAAFLMLVSMLAAPYSWIYDQGLVIPALFASRISCSVQEYVGRSCILERAGRSRALQRHLATFRFGSLTYWTAPAWLIWYLIATAPPRAGANLASGLRARWKSLCKQEQLLGE